MPKTNQRTSGNGRITSPLHVVSARATVPRNSYSELHCSGHGFTSSKLRVVRFDRTSSRIRYWGLLHMALEMTPGSNKSAAGNAAPALLLQIGHTGCGVPEQER